MHWLTSRLTSRRPTEGVPFGADTISFLDATSHFLIVGSPGSGKTITINRILKSVVPRIAAGSDWRALVYDGKTEAVSTLKTLGLPDDLLFIMNPFDRRSYAWDIASDIRTRGEVQELAQTLFPPQKTSVPFFENAANDLLQGVMLSFIRRFQKNWTVRDLLLAFRRKDWLQSILNWAPEQNDPRSRLYFQNQRTGADVLATARTKVAEFETVASYWYHAYKSNRRLSLESIGSSPGIIVLGHSHKSTDPLDRMNRVIFRRFSQVLLDKPNVPPGQYGRRTWMILDEVGKAGRLPGLEHLILKGRSKGVCFVLGFQDIASLESSEAYGINTSREIVDAISNKAVLRLEGPTTAKWAEAMFGNEDATYVKLTRQSSKSGASLSRAEHRELRPTVLESEFRSLPFRDNKGLPGFYKTIASQEAYLWYISPKLIANNPWGDEKIDFQPAPPSLGNLPMWSDDELAKFDLIDGPADPTTPNPALDDSMYNQWDKDMRQ